MDERRPVPELSTYGALFGVGALLVVVEAFGASVVDGGAVSEYRVENQHHHPGLEVWGKANHR